jgi:hypothetical protein
LGYHEFKASLSYIGRPCQKERKKRKEGRKEGEKEGVREVREGGRKGGRQAKRINCEEHNTHRHHSCHIVDTSIFLWIDQ